MNTIELNTLKKEFVKEFMNEEDETVVRRFIAFFRRSKEGIGSSPCQMTTEELKADIIQAEKDYENGNYITQEEMRKKHPA